VPDLMPAYRIVEWATAARLADAPVPHPGPGQVRVQVAGNGLCHSDFTMTAIPAEIGEMIGWQVPFTLGHEIGGWVEALGDGVTGWAVGDAVALVSPSSCGRCAWCSRGADNICPEGTAGRGYGRDGGLAPYVLAGADRDLVALGDLDPVTAGPLTDAGATSYHAVRRVLPRLVPGSRAVVIGVGGLGAFAVQFVRALSAAHVISVDTNPDRLEYARELGAQTIVVGGDGGTAAALAAATDGAGADVVLDFVGTDATIDMGVQAVARGGAYGVIGANGGRFSRPWYGGLPNDGEVFNFQGSSIRDVHAVVALARTGQVRNDVDQFPFDEVETAYDALHHGRLRGRAVVLPPPIRSEERRVGKECRSRWSPYH